MQAFRRVSEGLACGLDDWERELLARLALEVRALLQADDPAHEGARDVGARVNRRPQLTIHLIIQKYENYEF